MKTTDLTVLAMALEVVEKVLQVTMEEIEGHGRSWRVVWARWCVVRVLLTKTGLSLVDIGWLLDREHSTIAHARAGWRNTIETDPEARVQWEQIAALVDLKMSLLRTPQQTMWRRLGKNGMERLLAGARPRVTEII